MNLFSKIHIFEPMKNHIYNPNIGLISLMFESETANMNETIT